MTVSFFSFFESFFFLLRFYYFMGMHALVVCMHENHVHAWCPHKSEKVLNPLELELQMVVSYNVGAEI